jgi:hypothetical protein
MDVQLSWDGSVDLRQEFLELDGAMAGVQRADDFPRGDVQRGEETARARALVVVSRALGTPGSIGRIG